MSFFSSSYGSRGLIVLLAAVAAFLAYENRQLTDELATARSDTLKCMALGTRSTQAAAAVQRSESSPHPETNAAHLTSSCPSPAPDAVEKAAQPAAVAPQKTVPKILNSLQDAFPPKPPADTPPISTVSPLSEGGWGAAKP